jgi:hypothetical protein
MSPGDVGVLDFLLSNLAQEQVSRSHILALLKQIECTVTGCLEIAFFHEHFNIGQVRLKLKNAVGRHKRPPSLIVNLHPRRNFPASLPAATLIVSHVASIVFGCCAIKLYLAHASTFGHNILTVHRGR